MWLGSIEKRSAKHYWYFSSGALKKNTFYRAREIGRENTHSRGRTPYYRGRTPVWSSRVLVTGRCGPLIDRRGRWRAQCRNGWRASSRGPVASRGCSMQMAWSGQTTSAITLSGTCQASANAFPIRGRGSSSAMPSWKRCRRCVLRGLRRGQRHQMAWSVRLRELRQAAVFVTASDQRRCPRNRRCRTSTASRRHPRPCTRASISEMQHHLSLPHPRPLSRRRLKQHCQWPPSRPAPPLGRIATRRLLALPRHLKRCRVTARSRERRSSLQPARRPGRANRRGSTVGRRLQQDSAAIDAPSA